MADELFIIAEAGVNHNGDVALAKKMVRVAAECGADSIKFQTFTAKDLCVANTSAATYQKDNIGEEITQNQLLEALELTKNDFVELKDYCDKNQINFSSTPHSSMADVDLLEPLVNFYKIGSGDITNLPFIAYIANKKKKVILSTGMSNLQEVDDAVHVLKSFLPDHLINILHCTSNYPLELKEANLRCIHTLREQYGLLTGYSDNGDSFVIPVIAVLLGSNVVEKHFTLDRTMEGPDHMASMNPRDFKLCIEILRYARTLYLARSIHDTASILEDIKTIQQKYNVLDISDDMVSAIIGDGIKRPFPSELETAKVARKSIVLAVDKKAGDVIHESDLVCKRPGTGISPKHMYGEYNQVIGRVLTNNVAQGSLLRFEDLE